MRTLASLLLLAAAPAPAPPSAPATLAVDAEARWVPFALTAANQIRFIMRLDGREVVALLDTGVSHSVLSDRYPGLDRSRVRAGGRASAIGGQVPIGWVATDTLTLGGLTRRGGGLAVAGLPTAATGEAGAIDLLVGRDLVGGHALDIDYAGRRFRLLASGRLPFTGVVAPLRIAASRLVFEGELTLGGARLRPIVVDTGDGAAVTVSAAAWRQAGITDLPTTSGVSFGLGGPVVSEVAVVPRLRIGELTARQVEVRVEPAGGFSDAVGVAGRVGAGLLRHYRVLLDPGAGRMVLSPGAGADAPPQRSTSGLLLGVDRDRLRVVHVMRGGPAAAAGWREGEQICAVDNRPVLADHAAGGTGGWSIGAPGRAVRLRLCDGRERRLTLARFY